MVSRLDTTAEHLNDADITAVTYDVRRILLPTDGSATAVEATNVAMGLAKRFGAEVVGVFVSAGRVVDPMEEEMLEASEGVHHSRAGLDVAARSAAKNGVPFKAVVAEGATAHAILETATDQECDLIVIGNTGRKGIQAMMLGSVAESVVHNAQVPVMVIKHCSTQFCTAVRTDA